jgi:hypothetical protein
MELYIEETIVSLPLSNEAEKLTAFEHKQKSRNRRRGYRNSRRIRICRAGRKT